MSWICIALLPCIYCFSPLFLPIDVATAVGASPLFDYYVNDRTPTVELPGKQCPFTSPRYRLSIYVLSVALGIAAATLCPIQLHSLFLLPLDIPASILCYLFYLCHIQQLALRIVSLGLDSRPCSLWGVNMELYLL